MAPERRKRTAPPEDNLPQQQEPSGPAAVISRRASDRLRAGHVWVYRTEIQQVIGAGEPPRPGRVTLLNWRGKLLGTALFNPHSEIALRLFSREPLATEAEFLNLLRARLHSAIALRRPILSGGHTTAVRLVFSEADGLPGIILDKYGDLILLQIVSRALSEDAVRGVIVQVLLETLAPATIVERSSARIRQLEQMAEPALTVLYSRAGEPLTQTTFLLNGLHFHYDANAGQKTGAFLDQRENYAAAARHAHGRALDICTYQGGFALHLARSCSRVTGIDISRAALEVAERNLAANQNELQPSAVDWVEANAFDLLRDWSDSGKTFDTIVIDPPAFAKSKRALEGALRGYKELNLRALKMLNPGGILVTCSCSHHVSLASFTDILRDAATDAQRRLRLLERRGASPDHPVILNIPETEYLKCLICAVE